MNIKLEKGRALVLVGPQGCGKSLIAREIAKQHGSYKEVDADVLENSFELGEALSSEPRTVVVDGIPTSVATMRLLKSLITSNEVVCERRGLEPKTVPAPNFIFCSGDADALGHDLGDRRFRVLHLSPEGRA